MQTTPNSEWTDNQDLSKSGFVLVTIFMKGNDNKLTI